MTYPEFSELLLKTLAPVVLLEGTRELPAAAAPYLSALATHLARTFPQARFRTGNAKGSDEAFATGVPASIRPAWNLSSPTPAIAASSGLPSRPPPTWNA